MPGSPLVLCLDTSTKVCSVAIGKNGQLLALKESADEKLSHAENLTVFIDEACRQAAISLKDIDAVAVSKGPGSFTGLRIGVSAAKGLCYALNKPLIAVNSLEAMAIGCLRQHPAPGNQNRLFIPMIDARRMEVYCAVYDEQMKEVKKTSAEIIDENSFADLLSKNKMVFFGDGAEKCRSAITHPNAVFIENALPSAQYMLPLAEKYLAEKKFEDLAYFEPFYLKDFVGVKAPLPKGSKYIN